MFINRIGNFHIIVEPDTKLPTQEVDLVRSDCSDVFGDGIKPNVAALSIPILYLP